MAGMWEATDKVIEVDGWADAWMSWKYLLDIVAEPVSVLIWGTVDNGRARTRVGEVWTWIWRGGGRKEQNQLLAC